MLKRINNFKIWDNSSFLLQDTLDYVYVINNQKDYLSYLETTNQDFKVVWELTNSVINPEIINKLDILIYKDNRNTDEIVFLSDRTIEVVWNIQLKVLCRELLKRWYDASYLIGIPWTIAAACVNNSWSGRLNQSILDNVIRIEYYVKNKKYNKNIWEILFSYRNTEFKCMNNIFISKIVLKFEQIERSELSIKIEKRYAERSKSQEMYTQGSLGTFYIKNYGLDYKDILGDKISIVHNKIINYSQEAYYTDYTHLLKNVNILYEIEIEHVKSINKNDYVWLLVIDKNSDILLQQRDGKANNNKNKISLFWWAIEQGESIQEALNREVQEELSINIRDTHYYGLFMKDNGEMYQRCFVFYKYVYSIDDFLKETHCQEWNIFIKNLSNITQIIADNIYTPLLKKVLIYVLENKEKLLKETNSIS